MNKQSFTIGFRLPSLNEVIREGRANRYGAASQKAKLQKAIGYCIAQSGIRPIEEPCIIVCKFYEQNKKRDADNVKSAVKFIQDALVQYGILKNDSQRYVVDTISFIGQNTHSKVCVDIISSNNRDELIKLLKTAENAFYVD